MTAPRRTPPVASFSPEVFELLKRACSAPVRLVLPFKTAIRLRFRLYSLRKALHAENHPLAIPSDRINISLVRHGEEEGEILISPTDNDLAAVLRAQGITATPDWEDTSGISFPPTATEQSLGEDALSDSINSLFTEDDL